LLFHGAQSTLSLNSSVMSKTRRSVQRKVCQLLRRVGLVVRIIEVSGGRGHGRGNSGRTGES
jgi:hypothetical protein